VVEAGGRFGCRFRWPYASGTVTRIMPKTVACPACGEVQEATVVYSWNERLSGPTPPDAFVKTCAAWGVEFAPGDAILPDDQQRRWAKRRWWQRR